MRKLQATAYVAFAALLGLGATAPAYAQTCPGDCNDDGKVDITEVVTVINIALGGTQACASADGPDEGTTVEITDVVAAVNIAAGPGGACPVIGGDLCGNGVIDAGEDCDVGGICAGGSKSGTACTQESDCGAGEPGVCASGTGTLRQCASDADCGGGVCDRCRTYGAQPIAGGEQTCSATCTFETRVVFDLREGNFEGSNLQSGSGAVVHSGILGDVPLSLTGRQTFTVGEVKDGVAPIALKAEDVQFPPIPVSSIACACVRGVPAKTCGGFVLDMAGNLGQDCSTGFPTADVPCPAEMPCTFVHGPGNSGSGRIGCGGVLTPYNLDVSQDSRGSSDPSECLTPGISAPICADPPIIGLSGSTTVSGASIAVTHTAIGTKTGDCVGFCTESDPQSSRGTVNPLVLTSGKATGIIFNVDGQDDVHQWNPVTEAPWEISGTPMTCNPDGSYTAVPGELAGSFTAINQNLLGDIVVTILFEAK